MTPLPPKIDRRTYDDLVQQTAELVSAADIEVGGKRQRWLPAGQGRPPDPGWALIRIFGRMAALVSDRLNQVPDKNFLAFLALLGGQLEPPRPARVPLTFYLAAGSTSTALVPAHTQVAAPPDPDSDDEVVFATEQDLVVTTAQLQAVFVRQPDQDSYQDCTAAALGKIDAPFLAFGGDTPIAHHLYIACEDIFELDELTNVTLTLETATNGDANLYNALQVTWSYRDGQGWKSLNVNNKGNNNVTNSVTATRWITTFATLPAIAPYPIHGIGKKWLRATVANVSTASPAITSIRGRVTVKTGPSVPEVCLSNLAPVDLSKDVYPFGPEPSPNNTFYILLHQNLVKPGVKITIKFTLNSEQPEAVSTALELTWEYGDGQTWPKLDGLSEVKFTATTQEKTFSLPAQLPAPTTVNGKTGYWIRARMTKGFYGQPAETRRYVLFNDAAIANSVTRESNGSPKLEIAGNAADIFTTGDQIRLIWVGSTGQQVQERVVATPTGSTVTVNKIGTDTADSLLPPSGTRILRKTIAAEAIPPHYDPPLIKAASFTLAYEFTLDEAAVYLAENDFLWSRSHAFEARLTKPAVSGSQRLTLQEVEGLAQGDVIALKTPQSNAVEQYRVEAIAPKTQQIFLQAPLSKDYPTDSTLTRRFCPFLPTLDQKLTLYLGFSQPDALADQGTPPFNNQPVTLYAEVELPPPEALSKPADRPKLPDVVWDYASPAGWTRLPGVRDETQGFFQRGLIQFIGPPDLGKRAEFGQDLYWLRVRCTHDSVGVKPRLGRLLPNTTWAVQAVTLQNEVLGSSQGDRHQVFFTSQVPVLAGQQLEVQEGSRLPPEVQQSLRQRLGADALTVVQDETGTVTAIWVRWQEVPDFYQSQPQDRHYRLDRQTGQVQFGDGQAGMIPPLGSSIRLALYRTGGGPQGNKPAHTITQLKTTLPYVDRAVNLVAAGAGAPQEDLAQLKDRVPRGVRHGDRAVTQQDFEDLAYAASTDVARVKVITPADLAQTFDPLDSANWLDPVTGNPTHSSAQTAKHGAVTAKQVRVIIVPHSGDRQPIPSLALLKQVETHLRDRREPGVEVVVTGPGWAKVSITTTIVPRSLEQADTVRKAVLQRLEAFLHPLSGGQGGDGWAFGRYPHPSDLYAVIQAVPGVDHVHTLVSDPAFDSAGQGQPLGPDCFIYSGDHRVTVTADGGGG